MSLMSMFFDYASIKRIKPPATQACSPNNLTDDQKHH